MPEALGAPGALARMLLAIDNLTVQLHRACIKFFQRCEKRRQRRTSKEVRRTMQMAHLSRSCYSPWSFFAARPRYKLDTAPVYLPSVAQIKYGRGCKGTHAPDLARINPNRARLPELATWSRRRRRKIPGQPRKTLVNVGPTGVKSCRRLLDPMYSRFGLVHEA